MIVVDTNVVAYLYLPGPLTGAAEELLLRDPEWAAPRFWRSEFRNVLANYLRKKRLEFSEAVRIQQRAEELMSGGEYEVGSLDVLKLVNDSGCSAYDCEFIALAEHLGVKLVSADARLCRAFPKRTVLFSEA